MTSLRLDKWLWFARFAKTRSLAAKLCASGLVTVSGTAAMKSHHPVRVGDVIAVPQGRALRCVRVRALGERRGPPTEARLLYEDAAPPVPLRDAERAAWTPLLQEESFDGA